MFEKIKIRPLGDRVLVKRMETEGKTASGLFIPDAAQEKTQMGVVVAVGAGRKDRDGKMIPIDVRVNDLICFGKFAGSDANFGKTAGAQATDDFLIIKEDEILGVIEK
jgi:chaperonin GroES